MDNSEAAEKVEVIREISTYHPASKYGTIKGWSNYTGGFVDTGSWNFWKMYDEVSLYDLQEGLKHIQRQAKAQGF